MKALQFAVDCRGPADWVEIEVFDRLSDADQFVAQSKATDVRLCTAWRWEYRVREIGLDKPVEPSHRDDL